MNKHRYSIFQKFFWLISGSEIHILEDCKNDYNRHATMGFILFMTWLFATFAGGFAGWYFGHSFKTAFGFGVLWGLMIYAIDRGMVISLKKNPTVEKQAFWAPFIIRAILGVIIAFFISIPFEIFIFNQDIKIQMEKDKDAELGNRIAKQDTIYDIKGQENRLNADKKESEKLNSLLMEDCPLPEYKEKIEEYHSAKKQSEGLYSDYLSAYNNYIFQVSENPFDLAGKRIYYQRDYDARRKYQNIYSEYNKKNRECGYIKQKAEQIKVDYYENVKSKKAGIDTAITVNNLKFTDTNQKIDSVKSSYETMLSDLNGFTRQYVALYNAAKSSGSILFLMWLVRLGFFVIEILPTWYKLKTPIGDYDRAIYYREEMFNEELKTDLESKRTAETIRKQSDEEIVKKTENHRKVKEIKLNNTLIDEVARVQTDLATLHLTQWEKKERDNSNKKIDDFIKRKS